MKKVKILVVEDEIIIADSICDSLEDLGYEALEPAINYTEALETIELEKPALALLDIQLSGQKTGIDLAKKILDNYHFPFIFLTSNADLKTISEAKKVMPSAYLIKPFTKDELYSSIEVALFKHAQDEVKKNKDNLLVKDALFLKDKGAYHKLNFDDILYLKSEHVYIEFILTNKKKVVVRGSLNEIIKKLATSFIRVHRGYIINTKYLQQLDGKSLVIDKEVIPIGNKYREALLCKINYM